MKKLLTIAMAVGVVMLAATVQAASWRPLSVSEAAIMGATHVVRLTYEDFAASTATNTALVISNLHTFASNDAVECVGMVLERAFDTANTNYTGSCLLTVGDGSDADLYLTSTELASDGSEVAFKFGRADVPTIAVTASPETNTIYYLGATTNLLTNTVVFVPPTPTATASAGTTGRKVYTSESWLVLTFTPNAAEALSANLTGAMRIYFRKR